MSNVSNYTEQGGSRTVVGGSIDVISGGEIDIESGGALKIAGTAVTGTAAQLNIAAVPASGVETVAATNVITASESGKTFFLNHATEFVSTLPAVAAGLRYTFIVTGAPASASYTVVTASSTNLILGHVLTSQDAGGSADSETSGGDTLTFVDSKAVVGDRADFICDGTNWFVVASSKVFDAITITTAS